jgi:hypothetical protein
MINKSEYESALHEAYKRGWDRLPRLVSKDDAQLRKEMVRQAMRVLSERGLLHG